MILNPTTDCGNCGGTCPVTACVGSDCGGPVSGALVQLKSGPTVVDSGTTDGTGCVVLDVGAAGTYTMVVTAAGYDVSTTSQAVACGGSIGATLTHGSAYCCPVCSCTTVMKKTLTITDAFGSMTRTSAACTGWGGNLTKTQSGVIDDPLCASTSTRTMTYGYTLSCSGSTWQIVRQWPENDDGGGPCYGQSIGDACGSSFGQSRATFTVADCANFAWTGSLTQQFGTMPDPVGGVVAIS